MKNCTCPVGSAIQEVSEDLCPYDIGQIQKIVFQRKYSSGTTVNTFLSTGAGETVEEEAAWDTRLAAADGTKMQITPFIGNPEFEPGAKKEYGSGNQVVNGTPLQVGREFTAFTSVIYSLSPTIAAELKELECETLRVFFINEHNKIICAEDSSNLNYGFDIVGLFIGDRKPGGFEEPDMVSLEFNLAPNWSDEMVFITPEATFIPLEELAN